MVREVFKRAHDRIVHPDAILGKTDTVLDLVADARDSVAAGYASLGCRKSRRASADDPSSDEQPPARGAAPAPRVKAP